MAQRAASKAEQTEVTTRRLVEVARDLFAQRGFAHTGTEDLVRAAGVTRGALYHHFADKTALFHAVLDRVQQEVGAQVDIAADQQGDPWDQLTAGCRAFITASTHPGTQQIMLIDGPAVLGWQVWRAMDSQYSLRSLKQALIGLMADGIVRDQPVDPLAHLLSGAMNEAALWVAQSQTPDLALEQVLGALEELMSVLKAPPQPD